MTEDSKTISQIFPEPIAEVDVAQAVRAEDRNPADGKPWIYVNMVSTIDGATAAGDGLSGPLGGPADKAVFSALRSEADVIIAGANSVRLERYRAPQTRPEMQTIRESRGQLAKPLLVIPTVSANFDDDLPLFDDPTYKPTIVSGQAASEESLARLESRATVVRQAHHKVDLAEMVADLMTQGHRKFLLEGGPNLNGQFVAAGLIDEWNLSMSGVLAGGQSSRAAYGSTADHLQRMRLVRLWLADNLLFGRWVRGDD